MLFFDFIGDDVLVGHNIHSFDMKFIYRDSEKYFERIPNNNYIDTLSLARKCLPNLSHRTLSDLAYYYGLNFTDAHRALNDCLMNQIIFEKLGEELDKRLSGDAGLRVCPKCGQIMQKRNGRYGEFWGCGGYPNCRHTEKI